MEPQDHESSTNLPASTLGATEAGAEGDRLFIQSAARTMRVLESFAGAAGPMSLSEIAAATGMNRSAAQRVVHTLRSLGYLIQADGGTGFLPGPRVLDLAYGQLRLHPWIAQASGVLIELRRNVRERVDLSLQDDLRMIYALRQQSKRETWFATLVGHSVPVWCTSGGWAVLAALPEAEVDDILARAPYHKITARTLTDPAEIRDRVAETRARGYSLALHQIQIGEIALGVALTGRDGRPWGAVPVAASLSEWSPKDFAARIAPLAIEAALAIRMGG